MVRVRVKTPSRLHFCLMDLNGELGRVDGSLGVALSQPATILEVYRGREIKVHGEVAELVRQLALRFLGHFKIRGGVNIIVRSLIPNHVGLGSTTQLSLAVAMALARLFGVKETVRGLASVMGRGGTSGVGVATFEGGGLILDGGHSFGVGKAKEAFLPSSASRAPPPPLLLRYRFPEDWRFVVAVPNVATDFHGDREVQIFREKCPLPAAEVGKVCRIVLMKVLPALVERDIEAFGGGLTELQGVGFPSVAPEIVKPVVRDCMSFMLSEGAYGVGQSSFGPATYGLMEGDKEAERLSSAVRGFLDREVGGTVFCASANNSGASVRVIRG